MNPITDGQQPSWRLWGEEKCDGAIYTVYLKKVRYHPSSSVSYEDAEDSISHLEWETVRVRIIKAGTLERLVESLANDSGELESTYINIFLSTYRSFATPHQVLDLIIERYRQLGFNKGDMSAEMREQNRKTLVQTLMVWLDMYPEDLFDPPQFLCLQRLWEFASQALPGSMLANRARHRLDKFQREDSFRMPSPMAGDNLWCSKLNGNLLPLQPYEFHEISERHFAQQLTWMDAELFKHVLPHHCLGSMWSRREKPGWQGSAPASVTATVNQFNAVSLRVISSILSGLDLEPHHRAIVITKWIDISQELRFLKNFSSLKAITAALQSNAIYRLKKVWLTVPREKVEVFSELARIFSEENNQLNCRKLLIKEGSAKFAEAVGEEDRQLQKLMQRQLANSSLATMQGTVPYLGTFLTDLTMIDTAIPDLLSNGLINFDKRRKEFEVLAQIKLLQSSANNYNVEPDERFQLWFDTVNILDENESYQMSCLIEPPSLTRTGMHKSRSVEQNLGHRKTNSTSSTSTTCSSNSQFYDQASSDISMHSLNYTTTSSTPHIDIPKKPGLTRSNLSLPSLVNFGRSPLLPPIPGDTIDGLEKGVNGELQDHNPLPQVPEFYIIRVSVEQEARSAQDGLNVYKSIMLSNRDHTRSVIHNAMVKHAMQGDPENYTLSQLLPDGEIVFPVSANVYYAINTSYDLNFILRLRKEGASNGPAANRKKGKPVPLVKRLLNTNT